MYNPPAGGTEFIEIKNISSSAFSLAGVEVSGIGFIFAPDTPDLEAGGLVLLIDGDPEEFRAEHGIAQGVSVFGPYSGRLDNGGEKIRIKVPESSDVAGEGELHVSVDIADYNDNASWPAGADGGGFSLQRLLPAGYGGEPLNWELSPETGGNPGIDTSTPFDWRTLFFSSAEIANPDISGPLADADHDGTENILEYLLGTDPRIPNANRALDVSAIGAVGARRLQITLTLRNEVIGFIAIIEFSDTLSSWNESDEQLTLLNTTSNGDGTSTLVYQSEVLNNLPELRNMYFRVRAAELR
jgi:hypothetical protein